MGVCELCGEEGNLKKLNVEGTIMEACENCSKFGKIVEPPRPAPKLESKTFQKPVFKKPLFKKPFIRKKKIEDDDESEIVPDFNILIKSKRERLGLKQEHLAKKMMIKESIISKIESGHLTPSIDMARRFEKALKIKLIEKESDDSSKI